MRVIARVPSLSKEGRVYDLERSRRGPVCPCTRFLFQKRCEHVRIYEAAVALLAKCHAAEHGTEGLCEACLIRMLAMAARKTRGEIKAAAKVARKKRAKRR